MKKRSSRATLCSALLHAGLIVSTTTRWSCSIRSISRLVSGIFRISFSRGFCRNFSFSRRTWFNFCNAIFAKGRAFFHICVLVYVGLLVVSSILADTGTLSYIIWCAVFTFATIFICRSISRSLCRRFRAIACTFWNFQIRVFRFGKFES